MRNLNNILALIKNEDSSHSYQTYRERSIFYEFPFYHHKEDEWDTFVLSADLLKDRFYFYLRSHSEIKKINEIVPILNVTEWDNNLFVYHISKLTDEEIVKLYILLTKMIEKALDKYNLVITNRVDKEASIEN